LKTLQFYSGFLPQGYTFSVTPSLFNTDTHLRLQSPQGWNSFYLLQPRTQTVEALLHVHSADGSASSPLRAPYGAIEFSDNVKPEELFAFIQEVEVRLRNDGVKKLMLRCSPLAYDAGHLSLLHVLLLNLGYAVTVAEPGACVTIQDVPFANRIATSERQKLQHAHKLEHRCELLPHDRFDAWYDFVEHHMQARGYSVSMTRAQLKETIQQFPEHFFLRGVWDGDVMMAASVSVRVHPRVLYSFYTVHDARYDATSPVVMLLESLYQYCQQQGIPILDLGTSAWQGKPNFSLLDFKRWLGAEVTEKFTFEKILG
jgi:hypothetical protein